MNHLNGAINLIRIKNNEDPYNLYQLNENIENKFSKFFTFNYFNLDDYENGQFVEEYNINNLFKFMDGREGNCCAECGLEFCECEDYNSDYNSDY